MVFDDIAIIGCSCLMPGSNSPDELWDNVVNGRYCITDVPDNYWRIEPKSVIAEVHEAKSGHTWTTKGGYVRGFDKIFNTDGFNISKDEVLHFGELFWWLLHTARNALFSGGFDDIKINAKHKIGVVFGNLSYPSHEMSQYGEYVWLKLQKDFLGGKAADLIKLKKPHDLNRFMSGLPAHILCKALNLSEGGFALDAACASSLYAIKLACDKLQDGRADIMLAGGINRADDLTIHVGFCDLQAMSRTGVSMPLDKKADGLVPSEGAGFVLLMRLQDAIKQRKNILGVIRGIGLSNDGRGHGLLVPFREGQIDAMRRAYETSNVDIGEISLIECHATGTPVGDIIEIESMKEIFKDRKNLSITSIKSNIGHAITASGVAAIIKVLYSFKNRLKPKMINVDDPLDALANSPFSLTTENEEWVHDGPLTAAINNFGFGGNNAHLILSEYQESKQYMFNNKRQLKKDVAVVSMEVIAADLNNLDDFTYNLFNGKSRLHKNGEGQTAAFGETFELPIKEIKFPPVDLKQTLPQQLLILKAAKSALEKVKNFADKRVGVFIGMQTDAEAVRYGLRCRIKDYLNIWSKHIGVASFDREKWLKDASDRICPVQGAAIVLGAMPNIVTNRINSYFDFKGPSFSVFGEELSGIKALEVAKRLLQSGEIDMAVVGAVDLSCEDVEMEASSKVLEENRKVPGDAAVILILKRADVAKKDKDEILALVSDKKKAGSHITIGLSEGALSINNLFGHSHATSGLIHVAAAVLSCYYEAIPKYDANLKVKTLPWLKNNETMKAEVRVRALDGQVATVNILKDKDSQLKSLLLDPVPDIWIYSGKDRKEIIEHIKSNNHNESGFKKLVMIVFEKAQLEEANAMALKLLEYEKDNIVFSNPHFGIYYYEKPVRGDIAFVFAGAAGVYKSMGSSAILAFPLIKESIYKYLPEPEETFGWLYSDDSTQPTAEQILWSSTVMPQFHTYISRDILGLKPNAAIGYSSGESCSLISLGIWQDPIDMFYDFRKAKAMTKEVAGEFNVVKKDWKDRGYSFTDWANWWVVAPYEEVKKEVDSEPLVHITIINAPGDLIISGDSKACEGIISKIGRHRALKLEYNVASHCPEIKCYAEEWRKLHYRKTKPTNDIRIYTASTCSYYYPTADTAADAITALATDTLNFQKMIENAYNDGVRVFIEHGSRDACTKWIKKILEDKDDFVATAFDVTSRSSVTQFFHVVAELLAAGVEVDYEEIYSYLKGVDLTSSFKTKKIDDWGSLVFYYHPPRLKLPMVEECIKDLQQDATYEFAKEDVTLNEIKEIKPVIIQTSPAVIAQSFINMQQQPNYVVNELIKQSKLLSDLHKDFIERQSKIYKQFGALQGKATLALQSFFGMAASDIEQLAPFVQKIVSPKKPEVAKRPEIVKESEEEDLNAKVLAVKQIFKELPIRKPVGPKFNKEQLLIYAKGKISDVFGLKFKEYDDYEKVVRLPEPPLLLVDRVTGIEGEPGSMGLGTIWTETDITWDSWYQYGGYMPAGIAIESGQSDLMLISWLGIDFHNKGKRVYRLLGAEIMYCGFPPKVGETLCYQIEVESHAKFGDVRIFFFRYDCRVNGDLRMSVRHASAGFFTYEEIASSGGVLWKPEEAEFTNKPILDIPPVICKRASFSDEQIKAFSEGRVFDCFGEGFEITQTHVRSPHLQPGKMLLVDRVINFDIKGGPFGRGYIRAELDITPDKWHTVCHFKNDPCMPGTLMVDGAFQVMAIYLTGLGYTLNRDGWRFDPVPEQPYKVICRGQITSEVTTLIYEIFIEEIIDGDYPTIYADILGSKSDGLKIFHGRRMGLRLIPDYPLLGRKNPFGLDDYVEKKKVAEIYGVKLDYKAMLVCALGRPSDAFGDAGKPFDGPRRGARLPSPPYHFMTRVLQVDAEPGVLKVGSSVVAEYDVKKEDWGFEVNSYPSLPFCAITEICLQPCGWLSVFTSYLDLARDDLYYRNIEGVGKYVKEVLPQDASIKVVSKLTNISKFTGVILYTFKVESYIGDELIMYLETKFGFFTKEALAMQVGIPFKEGEGEKLNEPSDYFVDLTKRPEKFFERTLHLPDSMLLMLDRLTGYWQDGGDFGNGRIRAEKTVNASEWFFKCHFFQDPVMPGTLGVESIIQLLQAFMIESDMAEGIENPRFMPLANDVEITWKYRGQVVPLANLIKVDMIIKEKGIDGSGSFVVADANLYVDGIKIYHIANVGMRVIPNK